MKNTRGKIVFVILIIIIIFCFYQAFNYTNSNGDLKQQSQMRVGAGIIGGLALGYIIGVAIGVSES